MRAAKFALVFLLAGSADAWNAAGHRTIAYIAYRNLKDGPRARIDLLLQSHPDYARWVEGVPAGLRPLEAFLHASVWADEIKGDPRYKNQPRDAAPEERPSYPDMLRHQNWHYIDEPIGGDFAAAKIDDGLNPDWRRPPTVLSQIGAMKSILADKQATDAAKAWALAWLIHLVGDVHQPLHCVSRYGVDPSTGKLADDAGGNRVRLFGNAAHNLHAFWDGLMDEDASDAAVKELGDGLMATNGPGKGTTNEKEWQAEGARLAVEFVYPGLAGAKMESGALAVPRQYRVVATAVAGRRVAAAGYRLAQTLNKLPSK